MNFPKKFDLSLSCFNPAEMVKGRRFNGDHRMKGIPAQKEENAAIIVLGTSHSLNGRNPPGD